MSDLQVHSRRPADVLGPLNDVERQNAPAELHLLGEESLLTHVPRVAIVGSRKASPDGLERSRTYSTALARDDVVVVSGLAAGIDTSAHQAAMEAGGRTIAVLGTGLDRAYPAPNRPLQARIAREHLLVTQFPMGAAVSRKNFPMRNRTMALLCDATIIVEAGATSGSLHQGWEALRLGRLLFLDERIAGHPDLDWPEKMIGYGAQVLSFDTLPLLLEDLPRPVGVGGIGL